MKRILLLLPLFLAVLACGFNVTTMPPAAPTQTTASDMTTISFAARAMPTTISAQITEGSAAEDAEVRDLVENFGRKLQAVSLLAPDAVQEIQEQYSDFVSPALLDLWMNDVSKAPGRMVSSPWPDHIEVTALTKESPDRFEITGFIVEVTSVEVVNGGAAARIPVRIVVQKGQGRWFITEYAEEQ